MKLRIASMLLLFFAISSYADSGGGETLLANRSDGSKINYYLIDAAKETQSEVLLLVLQGSDCNSVMQLKPIFSDYRNLWPGADLLLIEKYGIDKGLPHSYDAERGDCPAEYLEKDGPEQRVADITTVLEEVLKNRSYKKFIVSGVSEGAVIANLYTASTDMVDATISFNGGARWFIDDVLHNIASEYENIEQAQESIAGFTGFANNLLSSEPFDLEMSGHGFHWWKQILSIDQLKVLQEVKSPLLIVQGGMDLSVSPEKVDQMMLELNASGKANIEFRGYEGLDHGFNNAKGQKKLETVIRDMHEWLVLRLDMASSSTKSKAQL